ncbi:hypothetical protein C2G38_2041789 [Gigaspora rosea]|uniref:Uncharacterized protein n=1 Tax=Gigaspora rosea TaxID=44941 RepID=A0A397USA9_9GLOM|nr:hypothetical protein C2G38_2041789 [Gigaspora rosea]
MIEQNEPKLIGFFDELVEDIGLHLALAGTSYKDKFESIDNLTIHLYEDAILELKEERSMKNLQLVDFKELELHLFDNYADAHKMIINISSLNNYLKQNVIPIITDWPGQLFIRKIIKYLKIQQSASNILQVYKNFHSIIGPLHVALNSKETALIINYEFFKQLFHFVFGYKKKLAKKPKPWRINLLLELAQKAWQKIKKIILEKFGPYCKDTEYRMAIDLLDNIIPATLYIYAVLFRSGSYMEYIETIFRIWTFALKWSRKNYNKAPLAFLSDIFYWTYNNYPFNESIRSFLVLFNDYYIENMRSRIRAYTAKYSTTDEIIREAFVIDSHCHDQFKEAFQNFKKYSYP